MSDDRDRVDVHLDAPELGERRRIASLTRERAGVQSVISFAYEPDWVSDPAGFPIDPLLPLFEGDQYPLALPGALADTAPDRWGRTLLERREALAARREDRRQRHLDDWDFLVGVDDGERMGALRLARTEDGAFIADENLPVPPATRLRELEELAREAEEGKLPEGDEEQRWISMLIAPGSSLGGARPKANFRDDDEAGTLWIAKFPSREDRHDVAAWEYVLQRLAKRAGIEVPEAKLLDLGSTYGTFCSCRFDRHGEGRRLYASAMTMTGGRDHADASYLDLARAIVDNVDPAAIEADLQQLFRRIVFNVLTANRDDHLRNHGFLRGARGWRLAPAFDVNPQPSKLEHSLALDASIHIPDLDLVRGTAPLYRLAPAAVDALVEEITRAVAGWREEAAAAGIGREEIDRLAPAFALAEG
jgi:serine/threonine-protein kinase HipA